MDVTDNDLIVNYDDVLSNDLVLGSYNPVGFNSLELDPTDYTDVLVDISNDLSYCKYLLFALLFVYCLELLRRTLKRCFKKGGFDDRIN